MFARRDELDFWQTHRVRRLRAIFEVWLFRPFGAGSISTFHPRLAPWAAFFRRFAAHKRYLARGLIRRFDFERTFSSPYFRLRFRSALGIERKRFTQFEHLLANFRQHGCVVPM